MNRLPNYAKIRAEDEGGLAACGLLILRETNPLRLPPSNPYETKNTELMEAWQQSFDETLRKYYDKRGN